MWRLFLVSIILATLFCVSASVAVGNCIKSQKVEFARGPSPTGIDWTASASVKKNGTCDSWLFGVEFSIPGSNRWGSGTAIPVGGHTPRDFTISGFNFPAGAPGAGVLGGYVGREVATIKLTMSDGTGFQLHPRFPRKELRQMFVWIRSFRYFLRYYSSEAYVDAFRLFNRAGTLLYRDLEVEGELW